MRKTGFELDRSDKKSLKLTGWEMRKVGKLKTGFTKAEPATCFKEKERGRVVLN